MPTGVSDATGRPPADLAVDVRKLHKSFGSFEALRGLDLEVRRGEVHGFLGPNGAGKSTTIRVLLGLLRANAGEVRLLGGDPWRDVVELHRRLAYVPGDVSLWPSMTGGEMIDLLGSMRGGLDEDRRADLVERFELDTAKRGRQYSKGNRQKVAIVAALASDVELLILDEPTSGLDPLMENVFQEVVGEAKALGTTVLLSSHILAEVESLADRVSIIRDGVIVETGTLTELRGHTRTAVRAELDTVPAADRLTDFHDVDVDGHRLSATVDSDRIGAAMEVLTASGLRSLTVEPPSLESLFLRLYDSDSDGVRVSDNPAAGE
ncbi:ABC transporter ATP-binding protein [Gordonia alkanivorans]|uniref:ABC transporter ATPase n=1 Tax=Gordonia alkanivorans CGMCC 6845 TaxID=1423140 RepID=W9DB33_9ACTN|nr:ABC transporter ATP-binding protein [Gordonia alkanivorans]ETA05544.1 ABC transporter ATPase [Gordonia alkanivorans CGMCC 6845]MDH3006782.1 ABC transporter ATP-binding protein [Gordonia alkanivorans]MDH3013176.1 ABC transporter ATP-binding protein [Gordonia alkanivorans]MDH3016596.1 ABC transporter ATP-binding protein [Gordonia alkanivorans]MDH3041515.1 ABC transporter ATP-binding protein [Gordonia alkanivorans]